MSTTQTNTPTPAVGSPVECPKCKPLASGGPSVRRVKDIVTTEPTVTVRLSCRHVIDMPAEAPADEPRPSEAAMAAVVADETDAAHPAPSGHVDPDVTVTTLTAVRDENGETVATIETVRPVESAVDRFARIKAAGEAETKRGPRVVSASREAKELKAWRDGGETGDRPATPNLDYIEAEEAARAERRGDSTRPAGPADRTVDPANPMALGLAQGPTGMVNSDAMTADDPKPARRTRERKADTASGGRVTALNLSAPRRAVMLEALPEAPDGEVQDVASVVALRTKVAAGADRVDVDAAGVRALLTGLAPMCTAGNRAACRLNDWLSKFAEEVGHKPADG